jgi:hypothetical protein
MIAGFVIAGFVWIAIGLLTIGLSCNAVWRAVMPPPGTPRQAGCGSCGYELTTLAHGRCSECGADLLKAGVSTRNNTVRIAGSLAGGIMGWTILAATLGSIVLYTISVIAMMSSMGGVMGAGGATAYDSNYAFGIPETYDNESGEYVREFDFDMTIEVDVMGDWSGPAASGTIKAIFEHAGEKAEVLFADAATTDWVMTNAAGEEIGSGTSFSTNDALAALKSVGLDPADQPESDVPIPTIAREAEIIIDTALNEPFNYETSYLGTVGANSVLEQTGGTAFNKINNPFGSTTAADWIVPLVVVGGTLIVWIAGMVWMIRRRGRLIAGPRDLAEG